MRRGPDAEARILPKRAWAHSGNLNGRPVGSRTAYSRGFFSDLADVWAKHGKETMIRSKSRHDIALFCIISFLIGWVPRPLTILMPILAQQFI